MANPNLTEGRVWKPIEASQQKSAVVSAASEFLIEKGVKGEILKDAENIVLTPPLDSDHWLQGVILIGHSDIKLRRAVKVYDESIMSFTTPEDKGNAYSHHVLVFTDTTPVVKGSDILSIPTSQNTRQITAGIRDVRNSESAVGSYSSFLLVPDYLKAGVKQELDYNPKAIIVKLEDFTLAKITNAQSRLRNQLGREMLVATSLTPVVAPAK